ncbi:DNA polymerase III subunit gamma/tau [Scytonema millei]|uniref:DNA polymerase III subunit gamma/tau n=1 Tax=Scytonema millei VB511283 TaxID=1245923 RepID=A0A9X5EAU6_9CYAN|nr:DNA polymerase III subunit gamma/tau [Scytonema millei]NHC38289.1 DNA polymerase III subunit gamma/tau [Scytonema millei VB511283]
MSYEPLHHKYRPQTFADLVGQEAIATTLTHAIERQKIAPAYLFTGPRGTGKTSSARILAKSLNCLNSNKPTAQPCGVCVVCQGVAKGATLDVIEIDAASNTGVDNVRELIERAQFAPVQCRYKVYAIDECHMLSTAAFNALLKTLEEPPAHVVFVLATTDPQRVLPTIISRCQRFDFRRIPLDAMIGHLSAIAAKESIDITPEAIHLVASFAQGGLRDAESLLDQLSLFAGVITVERIWDLVGSVAEPDLLEILQAIAQNQPEALLDAVRRIMDRGREPLTLLQNLAGFYRDLLVAKTAPNRNDLIAVTPGTWDALCTQAKAWDISNILVGQQHLAKSEAQIKNTTQPRLWLEVSLLGLLPSASLREQRAGKRAEGEVSSPSEPRSREQLIRSSLSPTPSGVGSRRGGFSESLTDEATNLGSKPARTEVGSEQAEAQRCRVAEGEKRAGGVGEAGEAGGEKTTVNCQPSTNNQQPTTNNQESSIPTSEFQTPNSSNEEVWLQVLACLQPHSTQALLKQMGRLIQFEAGIARIGMKSPAWRDRAKAYVPNIKAAFLSAFGQEVQVQLELATMSKEVRETTLTVAKIVPANSIALETKNNHTNGTAPAIEKPIGIGVTQPDAPVSSTQPATSFQDGTAKTPLSAAATGDPVAPMTSTPVGQLEISEFDIVVQRFAKSFNGEAIGDSTEFTSSTDISSISSATVPEWEDSDTAEDSDLDF